MAENAASIVRRAHPERLYLDAQLLGGLRRRAIAQRHAKIVLVPQHGDPAQVGHKLLQQPDTLRGELG